MCIPSAKNCTLRMPSGSDASAPRVRMPGASHSEPFAGFVNWSSGGRFVSRSKKIPLTTALPPWSRLNRNCTWPSTDQVSIAPEPKSETMFDSITMPLLASRSCTSTTRTPPQSRKYAEIRCRRPSTNDTSSVKSSPYQQAEIRSGPSMRSSAASSSVVSAKVKGAAPASSIRA